MTSGHSPCRARDSTLEKRLVGVHISEAEAEPRTQRDPTRDAAAVPHWIEVPHLFRVP